MLTLEITLPPNPEILANGATRKTPSASPKLKTASALVPGAGGAEDAALVGDVPVLGSEEELLQLLFASSDVVFKRTKEKKTGEALYWSETKLRRALRLRDLDAAEWRAVVAKIKERMGPDGKGLRAAAALPVLLALQHVAVYYMQGPHRGPDRVLTAAQESALAEQDSALVQTCGTCGLWVERLREYERRRTEEVRTHRSERESDMGAMNASFAEFVLDWYIK
jgi:hypothetical protein